MQSAKMNVGQVQIAQHQLGGRAEPRMQVDGSAEERRLFWLGLVGTEDGDRSVILTASKGKRLDRVVSSALAYPLRAPSRRGNGLVNYQGQ